MSSKQTTKTAPMPTETAEPAIKLHAVVAMESYVTDDGQQKEYVSILLSCPFPGEDFDQVRIAPKWRNTKGIFEFKAKKILKDTPSFELEGEVRPVTYFSKRHRRQVTYPGLFFTDPFATTPEEQLIPFSIKREEDAAVFSMLVSERFRVELDSDVALPDEGV